MKQAFVLFIRQFRKHPVFHLISIGGLALGVGIFTLIMLYVKKEFDHDRDVTDRNRMYRLEFGDWCVVPPALGSYMTNRYSGVEKTGRFYFDQNADVFCNDKHYRIGCFACVDSVVPGMFSLKFIRGNRATALSDPASVVLTASTASMLFGDDDPIGQTIKTRRGVLVKVTAVVADPDDIHLRFDALLSIKILKQWFGSDYLDSFHASNFPTYFTLAEGTDPAATEIAMSLDLKKNIYNDDPEENIGIHLRPLNDIYFFNTAQYETGARHGNKEVTLVLAAVGVMILLLAVINFVNMATAEALGRARETGLRKILGAPRAVLLSQYIAESFFISLFAVVSGMIIAWLMLPVFNLIAGSAVQLKIPFYLMLAAPLILCFLSGLTPALVLASFSPVQAMRGALARGRRAMLLRTSLVVFQFAISIALITGTVIIGRQFYYLQHRNMGFRRDGVLHFQLKGEVWKHKDELRNRLKQEPMIEEASFSQGVPGSMFNTETHTINNREIPFRIMGIDPWFIETMGMKIVDGRNFDEQNQADRNGRIILNQAAVKAIGWSNAIGQKFSKKEGGWVLKSANPEVIGVVGDFQFDKLNEPVRPLVFVWNDQSIQWVSVRYDARNEKAVIGQVEKIWKEWEQGFPLDYKIVGQIQQESLQTEARLSDVFLAMAAMALVIAALGQLGMAGYVTRKRRRELAIRKVNGAGEASLLVLLYRGFARWVLVAAVVAVPLTIPLAWRWLDSFPFHVTVGWIAPLVALLLTLLVSMLTVTWHGVKAVTANPADVLRWE
ncbi:MAG TPA: hypothetical protein DCR43_04735 [Bacteroidales bacterium]|nr:MAG: hypothetical protein A2X11_01655 [Bacteroidetes bacterium GWE2_42_24]OFY29730.1 MAG: hypothetical protein A2X09_01520 [Bacteroidetes bacterium GWF2_43_11]HAQ65145.1 hypothetical protein [Bacteroidales bacterium]HBZ65850.1 hypothetical protein [Bacteroidales bacterium]